MRQQLRQLWQRTGKLYRRLRQVAGSSSALIRIQETLGTLSTRYAGGRKI
jgi:hypothetical protein